MNVQEKPTTAFALSLVAGIFIILGAVVTLVFMGAGMMWGSGMPGNMGWECDECGRGDMMPGWGGGWWQWLALPMGAAGLIFGAIVLYASMMLNSRPEKHETWGILIIIFSILSVFGAWGGFGLGLILGIIGGILALSWKDPGKAVPAAAPTVAIPTPVEPTVDESARFCVHCGRQVAFEGKFCPHCGKELPE